MVVRTQISLDPEAHRRAKAKANQLGISLAEYLRRLVDKDLERPRTQTDPSIIFGLGDSGGSDVARFKDDYVADAVKNEQVRETTRRQARG